MSRRETGYKTQFKTGVNTNPMMPAKYDPHQSDYTMSQTINKAIMILLV